ncbi:MAG: cobalamin biosynthesis protein CobD [Euryarchaeota archaeon]|nr:cobalamin biosynthesis protein CobD [Euryarchaeota archaeon]
MSALVLAAALVLDRLAGEPPNRLHPTAWMGSVAERLSNRLPHSFCGGVLLLGAVTTLFSSGAYLLLLASPPLLKAALSAVVLKLSLSWRSLTDTALGIAGMLEEGRIEAAREALPALVGRDTSGLSPELACSACIESVSVDSVASPVFYFALLSAAGGLELGVAGAVAYRCVNTLDAMIGYRRYGRFGSVPAVADDVLNFLPARLMVPCMLLGAALLGLRAREGLRWLRFRRRLRSPNAGLGICFAAGALGVWLQKRGEYSIPGARAPGAGDVRRAVELVNLSLLAFVAGALVWLVVLC